MDTESVIETLTNISVGTVLAWVIVIGMIITAIATSTVKIYKLFDNYRDKQEEAEQYKADLKHFRDQQNDFAQSLKNITDSLELQKQSALKQLRFSIVQTCETALHNGEITMAQLKLIDELYDDYDHIWHKNGYVKTVVTKARKLPVKEEPD